MAPPRNQVLFGAAYYHEYQPSPRLDTDLDLMVEAGFSVIRVGESVWTTWEPEDGRFDLDWLAPVLDGAHQRGIARHPRHPDVRGPALAGPSLPGDRRRDRRPGSGCRGAGGRRSTTPIRRSGSTPSGSSARSSPATPTTRPSSATRSTTNPACCCSTTTASSSGSSTSSATPTATVEALNEAWGLVYWSHKLSTWADLWTPDGNWQPQYDLAWRTFQAKLTTEFIAWQADIVREYARDDQFVTTCIAYERPTVDDANLTRALDVTAGNPYYAMQDALAVPQHRACAAGLDHLGDLDPVPLRGPDVRIQAGAVPDHRDQRRRDRRTVDQLPGLRRPVAAGGLGLRRPRRRDDRVLALAHQPLRHRDVLDRHPARTISSPAGSTRS